MPFLIRFRAENFWGRCFDAFWGSTSENGIGCFQICSPKSTEWELTLIIVQYEARTWQPDIHNTIPTTDIKIQITSSFKNEAKTTMKETNEETHSTYKTTTNTFACRGQVSPWPLAGQFLDRQDAV